MEALNLRLSASRIGKYFEKMCQRSLYVEAVTDADRVSKLQIKNQVLRDSSNAWAGDIWEEECLNNLKGRENITVLCSDDAKRKSFSYEETLDILSSLDKNIKGEIYIYQSSITVENDSPFYKEYLRKYEERNIDISFSKQMYPDFLVAEYMPSEGRHRITIVDVKGADHLKSGAQVQIGIYAKILKSILEHKNINNCYVNEEFGIVWNKEPITKRRVDNEFSLKEAYAEIDTFFDETLENIIEKVSVSKDGPESIEKMECIVSAQCEFCPCFETCQKMLSDKRDSRLLPYISRLAQERLKQLISDEKLADENIDTINDFLTGDSSNELTDNCGFWKKIKNDLGPSVNGFKAFCDEKDEVYYKHGTTMGIPGYQDFALVLTAQRDVDSGRCYAYGWWLDAGKDLDIYGIGLNSNGFADVHYSKDNKKGEGTYYGSLIVKTNSPEEFDTIDRQFVDVIYDILCRIDELGSKSLQIYVMGSYERKNLEMSFYNILKNIDSEKEQEYLEKVMTILYWLQSENLATDGDSQPGEIVDNPVSVINSEVQKLYVLAEGISYNLKNISKALSPDFNFEGNSDVYFEKLSDVMDGMPFVRMCQAYNRGKKEEAENKYNSMKSHIIMRLNVERSIIGRIHKDARDKKIKIAGKAAVYKMQEKIHVNYPQVARLSFENKYEELLKYHQTRAVRLAGIDNAIEEGNVLQVEHIGGIKFKVLNYDKFAGDGWFSSLICEDTEYNRQQIMMFRDIRYEVDWQVSCISTYNEAGESVPTFYVPDFDMEYNFSDNGQEVTMTYKTKKYSGFVPVPGRKYLVFDRYTNYNSSKTEKGLIALEGRMDLLNPEELSEDMPVKWDDEAEKICKKYWSPDGLEFSPSQKEAFIHLFSRKLTVLVGPPASGKTDFIGRAVLTLSNYIKETEGRDMNILISANSHSAIENVLIKLVRMYDSAPDYFATTITFKLGKLEGGDEILLNGVEHIKMEKYAYSNMDNYDPAINIVGATCWSLSKAGNFDYDLVIIDEASQVRAMDAFITLEQSGAGTRFLIVGDDDQLPPIISGAYRKEEGKKYIHGSIFTLYLTALGMNHRDVIQLNDNFRMNDILCKYSSNIYGPDYHGPDYIPVIGAQKIKLARKPQDELIACLLDEDYPLVFCKLSGVASEQKKAETQIVADIVKELSESDTNPDGSLSYTTGNFWNEKIINDKNLSGACGIISPHHEHINRVRSHVARQLDCSESEVYIGTVDKLQGKERRNVIVSYGVYDKETIEKESEFIFSRNRFNVSLTRGKAKTIVILSEVIANSSITSNNLMGESEDIKKGIQFVQGFSDYMSEALEGEDMVHDEYDYFDGNVKLSVYKKKLV